MRVLGDFDIDPRPDIAIRARPSRRPLAAVLRRPVRRAGGFHHRRDDDRAAPIRSECAQRLVSDGACGRAAPTTSPRSSPTPRWRWTPMPSTCPTRRRWSAGAASAQPRADRRHRQRAGGHRARMLTRRATQSPCCSAPARMMAGARADHGRTVASAWRSRRPCARRPANAPIPTPARFRSCRSVTAMSPPIPTIPDVAKAIRRRAGQTQRKETRKRGAPQSSDRNPHRDRRAGACHGAALSARTAGARRNTIIGNADGAVAVYQGVTDQRVRPGAVARGQAHRTSTSTRLPQAWRDQLQARHHLRLAMTKRSPARAGHPSGEKQLQRSNTAEVVRRRGQRHVRLIRLFRLIRVDRHGRRLKRPAAARPTPSAVGWLSVGRYRHRTHRPPAQTAVTPNDPYPSPSGVRLLLFAMLISVVGVLSRCSSAPTATSLANYIGMLAVVVQCCSWCCGD